MIGHHDLAARPVEREAGRDDRHGDRDVLVHRDRAAPHAQYRCEQVSSRPAHLPPALVPRADAATRPCIGVFLQIGWRPARHRPERVAHEIGARLEDGELWTPAQERIDHRVAIVPEMCPIGTLPRRTFATFCRRSS